ncbi:hypothetical protein FGU65_09885 [Methanoculleus sp. FWC-SCC1]|uniref:Uncharacterized protein n=1 Tax=Methanoculleus frigidifontis TaxID=2584085 RepID=A0ABT8MB83_9EURY|nr:hypothetical protein [Methanoculleus sp. FWC-SCC1]MDN7025196.1 hypothetical protein [Methanoculleus sp. FWC-SCC1]
MAKRRDIPVQSYGSEVGTPSVEELAAWIAGRRGRAGGDLVTYQLETSLALQQPIADPCVGGIFYAQRLRDALIGFREGVLKDEPGIDPREVAADARALVAEKKGIRMAIPAPHLLGLADDYIGDAEEFAELTAELYARLMREMRDAGVWGHVLIADSADAIELENLAGRRCTFFPRDPAVFDLELLLEYQTELPILPDQLPWAIDRTEEYSIRRLVLMHAESGDLAAAAEYTDPERLRAGGYCEQDCAGYWQARVDEAFILR